MEIPIINETLFRANSPIKEDTIITKFIPYIVLAQKLYIRPILGDTLLTEIQLAIKTASESVPPGELPANLAAIVTEVAPSLSLYAIYTGLPYHWAAIQNKGVTLFNSENSDAVSLADINALRSWIQKDAERFAVMLTEYLHKCGNVTPGESCRENPRPKINFGVSGVRMHKTPKHH